MLCPNNPMRVVEFKGKKFDVTGDFLDLGLLEITDLSDIKGLEKIKGLKQVTTPEQAIRHIKRIVKTNRKITCRTSDVPH